MVTSGVFLHNQEKSWVITSWRHCRGISLYIPQENDIVAVLQPGWAASHRHHWLYHALATPLIKKTPLGRLAARKISTRSNPDAEPLQRVFDPESLIRTANKLKRLVPFSLYQTSSLPLEGATFIDDISEHGGQNFDLILPRTKSESSLFEAVFDPSPFDFSRAPWLLETSTFVEEIPPPSPVRPCTPPSHFINILAPLLGTIAIHPSGERHCSSSMTCLSSQS